MGFYELLLQVGGVIGFWINYAVTIHIAPTSKQWHIPVAIQFIPGGLLVIGAFFLPESPRWIRSKGNLERSQAVTAMLRNLPEDHVYVQQELEMMDEQLAQSAAYRTYGAQMKELFVKGMRNRLASAFLMMMFQNLTGINAINYYSPRIFASIGLTGSSTSLFGTGIYGIVKLITTFIWTIWLIDNVGRRRLLIFGSIGAIFSLFYVGAYLQISHHGGAITTTTNAKITSGGISAAAFIYIFAIFFSASWNGTSWVYIGEIFPNHLRTLGVSLSAANQWLWQFVVARSTPYMLSNIKAGTYFFFGACTVFGMLWAIFLMPETKGVTLEGMDEIFGYDKASRTAVRQTAHQLHHDRADTPSNTASTNDMEKGRDDQVEYA
ncbi:general substrate transporter [Clavulina sp. PMI_390]|nr:general substrate transporter [Clavulina sp. PMI_390]